MDNQTLPTNGDVFRHDLTPTLVPINELWPLGNQTRRHPRAQIEKLAANLREYGFVLPIVLDATRRVVAGWALVLAAKLLGLDRVPAVTIVDLSETQLRMLKLALNRLPEDASWDPEALRLELTELLTIDPQIDLQLTGFSTGELDIAISDSEDLEDDLPPAEAAAAVTQPGDLWVLGEHRVICADALQAESYCRLMGDQQARMVFADPPYNRKVRDVSGRGRVRHNEFAMASGEMSFPEFEAFLASAFAHVCGHAIDGSLHFVCMDWRGTGGLLRALGPIYAELKNLIVWSKTNPGMGSLYRSGHEFLFLLKKGCAPHVNNIQLGKNGRNRSNLWTYPAQNVRTSSSKSKLSLHPTVKPVAMIADAIRDCSNEHDIILDPFGGAGTTVIAAERTRRRARLIEIEPRYVDVTIRRWQHVTGKSAVHAATGVTFEQRDRATSESTHD